MIAIQFPGKHGKKWVGLEGLFKRIFKRLSCDAWTILQVGVWKRQATLAGSRRVELWLAVRLVILHKLSVLSFSCPAKLSLIDLSSPGFAKKSACFHSSLASFPQWSRDAYDVYELLLGTWFNVLGFPQVNHIRTLTCLYRQLPVLKIMLVVSHGITRCGCGVHELVVRQVDVMVWGIAFGEESFCFEECKNAKRSHCGCHGKRWGKTEGRLFSLFAAYLCVQHLRECLQVEIVQDCMEVFGRSREFR